MYSPWNGRPILIDGLFSPGEWDDALAVQVPSFRGDLEREIDLIEEVARIVGYDRIPSTIPEKVVVQRPPEVQRGLRQDPVVERLPREQELAPGRRSRLT